jgi:hypothetical protein
MGPAAKWLSPKPAATSSLQQHTAAAVKAAAVPASPAAGCGGSSSEDGDVFIDGMMA